MCLNICLLYYSDESFALCLYQRQFPRGFHQCVLLCERQHPAKQTSVGQLLRCDRQQLNKRGHSPAEKETRGCRASWNERSQLQTYIWGYQGHTSGCGCVILMIPRTTPPLTNWNAQTTEIKKTWSCWTTSDALAQCCFEVEPVSATLALHQTSVASTSRIGWDARSRTTQTRDVN